MVFRRVLLGGFLFVFLLAFYQACGRPFQPRQIASLGSSGTFHPPPSLQISDVAPDATLRGPSTPVSSEYRLAPTTDAFVLADRPTELWAQVYRPQNLGASPLPLAIFLHGNHATCGRPAGGIRIDDNCQYTNAGTCPTGYEVAPNHLGYAYLAEVLASWGYLVVSINANRGITCGQGGGDDPNLNLARGRLILRHLMQLAVWNQSGGAPASLGFDLRGRVDFSRVGLMGHSRGGEGARAAYNLYRDAGSPWPQRIGPAVNFRGIFEIAPVDGQTPRTLDAPGTPWAVILPLCDGDVRDLSGARPFDRMVTAALAAPTSPHPPLSALSVWGANHNFYNTEWQVSDSEGCSGHPQLWQPQQPGSEAQRLTAVATLVAFFRAHVGQGQSHLARNLDGAFKPPSVVTSVARVDRASTRSESSGASVLFEDFRMQPPQGSQGLNHVASRVVWTNVVSAPHAAVRRMARLSWDQAGQDTYFELRVGGAMAPADLSSFTSLDLDLARAQDMRNTAGTPTDFEVHLVDADGARSQQLAVSQFFRLLGPGGNNGPQPVLSTLRLPLSLMFGADLRRIVAVRLTFNRSPTGVILLSAPRVTRSEIPTLYSAVPTTPFALPPSLLAPRALPTPKQMRLVEIRPLSQSQGFRSLVEQNSDFVEVEFQQQDGFPVTGSLPRMEIPREGQSPLVLEGGYFPEDGDTRRLLIKLPRDVADLLNGSIKLEVGSKVYRLD